MKKTGKMKLCPLFTSNMIFRPNVTIDLAGALASIVSVLTIFQVSWLRFAFPPSDAQETLRSSTSRIPQAKITGTLPTAQNVRAPYS